MCPPCSHHVFLPDGGRRRFDTQADPGDMATTHGAPGPQELADAGRTLPGAPGGSGAPSHLDLSPYLGLWLSEPQK